MVEIVESYIQETGGGDANNVALVSHIHLISLVQVYPHF